MDSKQKPENGFSLEIPTPAINLLPHRGTMLLVDELVDFHAASGRGRVRARDLNESPFVARDGFLEEVVLIEMLAQAYACVRGYEDLKAGRPIGPGFLVGIRRWHRQTKATTKDKLIIEIATTAVIGDFFLAEGKVFTSENLVAGGELKLWAP